MVYGGRRPCSRGGAEVVKEGHIYPSRSAILQCAWTDAATHSPSFSYQVLAQAAEIMSTCCDRLSTSTSPSKHQSNLHGYLYRQALLGKPTGLNTRHYEGKSEWSCLAYRNKAGGAKQCQ